MKFKTLKTIEGITCLVMTGVMTVTIIYGLWYLPLIAIFCAAVMFGVLIYRMKEPYEDELTHVIDEKSGNATKTIANFGLVIAGSILLAVNNDISTGAGLAAVTVYAVAVGLNLISYFTKLYYRRKLGGN
jgi:uncharacterized membrane protein